MALMWWMTTSLYTRALSRVEREAQAVSKAELSCYETYWANIKDHNKYNSQLVVYSSKSLRYHVKDRAQDGLNKFEWVYKGCMQNVHKNRSRHIEHSPFVNPKKRPIRGSSSV